MNLPSAPSMDPAEQRKLEVEMGLVSQRAAEKFDRETKLPKLRFVIIKDAKTVKYLGAGAFNQVYEVKVGGRVLARKGLKGGVKNSYKDFKEGAVDLVYEAKLLNTLMHPHILQMQGVSTDSWKDCYANGESFCLYLDKLTGSVLEKFEKWHDTKDHSSMNREMVRRLEMIALPIAEAVAYLHDRKIVFRDIKPSNMGLDVNGIVKLYDFGMAREVDPDKKLTGCTGTILYMSPEVALSQHYGLPADVYSYAMFLFECCSLTKPCIELTKNEGDHFKMVVQGHYRPKLSPKIFSSQLQILLTRSWAKDPSARPPMPQVVTQLQECIGELDETLQTKSWFAWPAATNIGLSISRSQSGDSSKLRIARTKSTDQTDNKAPRVKKIRGKEKPRQKLSVSGTWFSH